MSCDQCSKGYILDGEPTGKFIGDAYFVTGAEVTPSKRAVVLLMDAFGMELKNSKLIADELAKRLSCDIWIPDIFEGSPLLGVHDLEGLTPEQAGVVMPFTTKLRLIAKILPRAFHIYRKRPAVVAPKIIEFIKKLKDDQKYAKVGAVGYCYGGSCAALVGASDAVDSVVICHPGGLTPDQVNAIKVPNAWACAEDDHGFTPEIRKKAEETLAARKGTKNEVDYEFHVYEGTAHGFAARPNLSIPKVKAGFEGALAQTVAWFDNTLV
ncbi:hypothetical protein PLICRDRAFT_137215 [Plicaturopsis crispa FD-325 SS-3]|nr:hypothetical protein PLICRDRAFT_137215 [Plicaturopsis crispa FD-325 SS-3]